MRDGCCGLGGYGTLWDMQLGIGVNFLGGQIEHSTSLRPPKSGSHDDDDSDHKDAVFLEVPHLDRYLEQLVPRIARLAACAQKANRPKRTGVTPLANLELSSSRAEASCESGLSKALAAPQLENL